jgi:malate dehydrogenase (quinone)
MLELIGRCFGSELKTTAWQTKLREMIPSHGVSLAKDTDLLQRLRSWTTEVLDLEEKTFAGLGQATGH